VSSTFATTELGALGVAVQQVLDHPLRLLHQVGADLGVAQLVLGLRLEDRVLQADGHRADQPLPHVVALEGALAEGC
jgi:hypothetical protein